MPNMFLFFSALITLGLVSSGLMSASSALAQDTPAAACRIKDRGCVIKQLKAVATEIDNKNWRDQTYREIAKTLAFDGDIDGALGIVDQIENPDTKALTLRGIGFAAADNKLSPATYEQIFTKLRTSAEKITHPPSYAIALTYIAMGQAFAGDNDGAWSTAADMENDALRHKAYGETAEIQAEHGDFEAARKSIEFIESAAFRNKAYAIVSKILADRKLLDEALSAANAITNAYKKSQALQYVLDAQKPREVKK